MASAQQSGYRFPRAGALGRAVMATGVLLLLASVGVSVVGTAAAGPVSDPGIARVGELLFDLGRGTAVLGALIVTLRAAR